MLAEITSMQLMCWRLSKLADAGRMTAAMASLAKMNHAAKARAIVADARDILVGDGILLDNHVARHHADMERSSPSRHRLGAGLIVGRDHRASAISGLVLARLTVGAVRRWTTAVIRWHSGAVRPQCRRAPLLGSQICTMAPQAASSISPSSSTRRCASTACHGRVGRSAPRTTGQVGEPHGVTVHVRRVPRSQGQSPRNGAIRSDPVRQFLIAGRRPECCPPRYRRGRSSGRERRHGSISLLVGGVLLAVGFAAGRIGRRRPPPPRR